MTDHSQIERDATTLLNGVLGSSTHERDSCHLSSSTVPLQPFPAREPSRKLRVVTIGAGYSGLTLAHKIQHQHPEFEGLIEHVIYEARSDIGGTWLANTYPGVVCDVPSHIYVRTVQGELVAVI